MIEKQLYRHRFSEAELERQRRLWRPIAQYLQRYVKPDGVTLDLGAGYCHFINEIRSGDKIAVDINPDNLLRWAAADVRQLVCAGADLSTIAANSVDTVFASNVYEHFQTREDVAASFTEVHRILKPGGRFLILQPNFAHCARQYFDFFDHRLIFTHLGMAEGLAVSGFRICKLVPQFLPYSSKSRLPSFPWLVATYLRMPLVWRIFGAQMLIVAKKAENSGVDGDATICR